MLQIRRSLVLVAAAVLVSIQPAQAGPPAQVKTHLKTVAERIETRELFGLRSDADFVAGLVGDESPLAGIPLTPDEAAEMARREKVQLSLGPVKDQLARSATFGGLYIDQAAGGVIDIAFTRSPDDATLRAIADVLPDGATVRFRIVPHSEEELDRTHRAIEELAKAEPGIGAIRTDVRANVVNVETWSADRQALEPKLRGLFGEAIVISEAGLFQNEACTSRSSCTPYRAGIQLYDVSNAICTSAFLAKKNGVATYYILTAGHCGPVNSAWFHDEVQVGIVKLRAYADNGNADAEAISRAGSTGHKNWIYVTNGEMARTVTAREGHDADTVGDNVCIAGYFTGFFCGTIVDTDVDNIFDGVIHQNNLREATYSSVSGDSGSPIFYGHTAKGIHKGSFPNGHKGYTQIWEAENAMGVTVLVAPT